MSKLELLKIWVSLSHCHWKAFFCFFTIVRFSTNCIANRELSEFLACMFIEKISETLKRSFCHLYRCAEFAMLDIKHSKLWVHLDPLIEFGKFRIQVKLSEFQLQSLQPYESW